MWIRLYYLGTSERSKAAEDMGKTSVLGSPLRVLFLSILTHNEGAVSRAALAAPKDLGQLAQP